ncbi:hypothetical protein RJ40_12455 [Methanofollis aquaemaris]|uniref:Uncharacterized protein n=1 Tax=Methanofollis aquaemaris TaxID=126734 RepID=A0A8A3S7Z2_9EURY|nr:hypothetical protein [Methanofollis aquaemaris]QSZ68245.1 hypothetical protein RJ40_12455 [Methanofollis aquaemaris]
MKALKLIVLLLAMLIAVTTMVSMLGAAGEGFNEHDRAEVNKSTDVPDHFIPPEYFKDARPATPLPESEMISFILSEKTLNTSAQDKRNGIIELPGSSPCQDPRFMKYREHQTIFIETNIDPDDAVVLVRMPESMYERFLADAQNNTITLPASHFCMFYDNLTDLDTHIACNGSVLTVLPGESDANKNTTIPPPIETPSQSGVLG